MTTTAYHSKRFCVCVCVCLRFRYERRMMLSWFAFQGSYDTLLQAAHINSSSHALQHLLKHYINLLAARSAYDCLLLAWFITSRSTAHRKWMIQFCAFAKYILDNRRIIRWRENDVFQLDLHVLWQNSYIFRNRKLTQFSDELRHKNIHAHHDMQCFYRSLCRFMP